MTGSNARLWVAAALALGLVVLGWLSLGALGQAPGGLALDGPAREPALAEVAAGSRPMSTASRFAILDSAPATAATRAAEGTGSLLVRAVWLPGKEPAAEVNLQVLYRGRPNRYAFTLRGTTDERGEALFEGVRAGSVVVLGDRDLSSARVTIEPGKQAEATVEIAPGVDASGIVVDASGVPVPGAELWLVNFDGLGSRVARAGGDGRFLVRATAWAQFFGARAPGYAPSKAQQLLATAGGRVEVRLVLPSRGGEIEGVVLDPEGKPVRGAAVVAGDPRPLLTAERATLGVSMARLESDAHGRFRATGLAPGTNGVVVRAEGMAPWRGKVEVFADTQSHAEIRLARGATLVGSVSTSARVPVPDARISVGDGYSLLGSDAPVAPDGTFRMEHLEAGQLEVRIESDQQGRGSQKVTTVEGGEARLDFVYPELAKLPIRVVDAAGRPLAKWWVHLEDQPSGMGETDADGRFVFERLHERTHRLLVHAPKSHVPSVRLDGVLPSAAELLVRVPADAMPSVRISGTIVDGRDRPIAGVMLSVGEAERGGGAIERVDPQTGRFELGPFPAGNWRLSLTVPSHPPTSFGPKKLAAGESWDLGTIRVLPTGTLAVALEPCPGLAADACKLGVIGSGAGACEFVRRGEDLVSTPLNPGEYSLRIEGPLVANRMVRFTIEPEVESRLRVRLEPGLARTVRVAEASPDPKLFSVAIVVRDGEGKPVYEGSVSRRDGKLTELGLVLLPGQHSLVATTRTGLRAEATLVVAADERVAEPVVLSLR